MKEIFKASNFSISSMRQETLYYAGLIIMAVFVLLRFWRIDIPAEVIFDEVYYPKYANQMLNGGYTFDVHPPLGKIIIAIGELLFGDKSGMNFLSWRIMPALFGSALIPITYWTSIQIFKNKTIAFVNAFLVAIDGMFIVYSRTGLLDIFILFFGVVSAGFCWKFRNAFLNGKPYRLALLFSGIFASMAMDIKWSGAAFPFIMAITTIFTITMNNKGKLLFSDLFLWFITFFFLPLIIYTLPFLAIFSMDGFGYSVLDWHKQALDFSMHLNATHPYASKWWTWPFLVHPVWFFYKESQGFVTGINGVGNLLTWWSGTVAVVFTVYSLIYDKITSNKIRSTGENENSMNIRSEEIPALLFIIGTWIICFLPWAFIGRIVFLYHYMPAHIFALFLCGYWIGHTWDIVKIREVSILFLIGALLISLFFIPVWIGFPIPQEWFRFWIWFETWT